MSLEEQIEIYNQAMVKFINEELSKVWPESNIKFVFVNFVDDLP
jgi:hypothetical protein